MRAKARKIVEVLLRDYGRTFAEELGIDLEANDAASLFRLLCACLLFSTRISHVIARKAASNLYAHGWTTPQEMAASTWGQRVSALDDAGYVRYNERTARMLGETAQLVLDLYQGDLRELRRRADCQPDQERKLLKEFSGIGEVGVNIFFREVQVVWPELFPYLDARAAESAGLCGLHSDPKSLARFVKATDEFARLAAALVRVRLGHRHGEILEAADKSSSVQQIQAAVHFRYTPITPRVSHSAAERQGTPPP